MPDRPHQIKPEQAFHNVRDDRVLGPPRLGPSGRGFVIEILLLVWLLLLFVFLVVASGVDALWAWGKGKLGFKDDPERRVSWLGRVFDRLHR